MTLRIGAAADAPRLAYLAALDSAQAPGHPVLLAEVDGQLLAALGLSDGTVVADPFQPTADLIDLLRVRARQLNSKPRLGRHRRPRWSRLPAAAYR